MSVGMISNERFSFTTQVLATVNVTKNTTGNVKIPSTPNLTSI